MVQKSPEFSRRHRTQACAIRMSSAQSKWGSSWADTQTDRQIQLFMLSLSLSLPLQTQRSSCLPYWQCSSVWWMRCLPTAVWPNYPKHLETRFRTWRERVLWASGRNGIWWPEICTETSRRCETSRCFSTHITAKMLCVTQTDSELLHLQFERDFRETMNMTAYEGARIKTPLLRPSDGCVSRNFSAVRTHFPSNDSGLFMAHGLIRSMLLSPKLILKFNFSF